MGKTGSGGAFFSMAVFYSPGERPGFDQGLELVGIGRPPEDGDVRVGDLAPQVADIRLLGAVDAGVSPLAGRAQVYPPCLVALPPPVDGFGAGHGQDAIGGIGDGDRARARGRPPRARPLVGLAGEVPRGGRPTGRVETTLEHPQRVASATPYKIHFMIISIFDGQVLMGRGSI